MWKTARLFGGLDITIWRVSWDPHILPMRFTRDQSRHRFVVELCEVSYFWQIEYRPLPSRTGFIIHRAYTPRVIVGFFAGVKCAFSPEVGFSSAEIVEFGIDMPEVGGNMVALTETEQNGHPVHLLVAASKFGGFDCLSLSHIQWLNRRWYLSTAKSRPPTGVKLKKGSAVTFDYHAWIHIRSEGVKYKWDWGDREARFQVGR